jgi:hypothetical protein
MATNKYEIQARAESVTHDLAPVIDIYVIHCGACPQANAGRQDQSSGNTTYGFPYTIPDELRGAARIVTESTLQQHRGEDERVAQKIQGRCVLKTSDANSLA